jgi:hypothetical protein
MELISWIASFFILISFLFDGWKLRALNLIGAILWILWGREKGELSVVVLNCAIGVIQCYKLYKLSIEGGEKSFLFDLKKFFKERHDL